MSDNIALYRSQNQFKMSGKNQVIRMRAADLAHSCSPSFWYQLVVPKFGEPGKWQIINML
jgi:hypothetical protein